MNKLTTIKQMSMQTWWAVVGARSKLRSKVKFVSFSRLVNFVRQRRKTEEKCGRLSGKETMPPIKQTEKSLGPVGSVFLIIF